jgi:hypothetical protein
MSSEDKSEGRDALDEALDTIDSAFDRFQEAHFWLHGMEQHYHAADPFRWCLNSFLRSLKEVPQLIQMSLQNKPGFSGWFQKQKDGLRSDPLLAILFKQRDILVHQAMLIPESRAFLGVTEGRGMKLGITFPIHPLEDSDAGMDRYLDFVKTEKDFLGVLADDEDSVPCVEREWRIPQVDGEIIDVCAQAWLRVGETVKAVLEWQGAQVPPLALDCRHSGQQVRFRLYERAELLKRIENLSD